MARLYGPGMLRLRGRRALALAATSFFALAVLACGESEPIRSAQSVAKARSAPGSQRANLLLITLDTTRADALGAYGQRRPTTPRIDRLAQEGVLFEQVTTSNPETLPAHATIFTGRWPYAHGVRANAGYVLPESNLTLAEVLRSHGYRTGAEIASRVLRPETRISQGFEHARGAESPGVQLEEVRFSEGRQRKLTKQTRVGSDISKHGIEFLRQDREQPFFLWLHYFDPHDPYSAPALFNQKIPDSPYHADVASADFQMGLVLDELERLGLRETTLVVVTADHGEGLGEHGEPSHSYFVYDSTMRVPLILSGLPELPHGRRIPSLVRTVDIAPTLLDLLQLPGGLGEVDGTSLKPLISAVSSDLSLVSYGEATRFSAVFGLPTLRFVREGRWKYVHKVEPELYDVVSDPEEGTNLSAQHPEITAKLRAKLAAMVGQAPRAPEDAHAVIDAQTAAELAALGYVDQSPAAALQEGLSSLDLWGEDPRSRIADSELLSVATGLVDRKEFAAALERIAPVHEKSPDSVYVLNLLSSALLGLERNDEAVPVLGRILALEPCNEKAGDELARLYRDQREHRKLVGVLARGAEKCPDEPARLNNYAWALATLPDDTLRNGARAVGIARAALAKAAAANADAADPAYLDTLAAALAETGDFEEAVRVDSDALRLLKTSGAPAEILVEVEAHIERYRAGRALRDPEAGGA